MTNFLKSYGVYLTALAALIYAALGFFVFHTLTANAAVAFVLGALGLGGGNVALNTASTAILVSVLNALGANLPENASREQAKIAAAKLASKAGKRAAPVVIACLMIAGLGLPLMGCSTLGLDGGLTQQDVTTFSAVGSAVKASMDFTIGACVTQNELGAACTTYKGQIKAASQALDTLFDQGVTLVGNSNSTSAEMAAILGGIAGDVAAYEQVVADLQTKQMALKGRKAISATAIITILSTAIPVIEQVYQAFAAAQTTPPTTDGLNALVRAIDADNAAIQAW